MSELVCKELWCLVVDMRELVGDINFEVAGKGLRGD